MINKKGNFFKIYFLNTCFLMLVTNILRISRKNEEDTYTKKLGFAEYF